MTPILLIFSLTCLLQALPDQSLDQGVAENALQGSPSAPILRPNDSRIPLLREGVFLKQVPGTIHLNEKSGFWHFQNDLAEGSQTTRFGRTFGILPSSALADAITRIKATEVQQRFEVSARVTVYHGMNYLLPTLVTAISDLIDDDQSEVIAPDGSVMSETQTSKGPVNSLDDRDDTGDRLEERLRNRLGSLPVSSDMPQTNQTTSERTTSMSEGDRIQNRRCTVLRDQRSGTWRVIFESEGSDQRDPTMEILPCLLLGKLERRSAQSDLPGSILLSGEVTRYRGRNYLLPTRWRPTTPSSNIQP